MTRQEAIEFVMRTSDHLSESARILNRMANTFDQFARAMNELAKEIEKGFEK